MNLPKCPACGHRLDFESITACVTYWGDDGSPKKIWCDNCDAVLLVREKVERTWTVTVEINRRGREESEKCLEEVNACLT